MGKGFKHGAGGADPLNFTLKAYPSEVDLNNDTPKKNTIGIVTTEPITYWSFSSTQPGAQEGTVWICTGLTSPAIFNAVKKNNLRVYPLYAKQYISGAWVDKTAKIYNGSEWVDFIFYLFHDGKLNPNITGWTDDYLATHETKGAVVVNESEKYINFTAGIRAAGPGTAYHFANPSIDMTPYKKVTFDIRFGTFMSNAGSNSAQRGNGVAIASSAADNALVVTHVATISARQSVSLDVSSLTGNYYICLFVCSASAGKNNNGYCYDIRFD